MLFHPFLKGGSDAFHCAACSPSPWQAATVSRVRPGNSVCIYILNVTENNAHFYLDRDIDRTRSRFPDEFYGTSRIFTTWTERHLCRRRRIYTVEWWLYRIEQSEIWTSCRVCRCEISQHRSLCLCLSHSKVVAKLTLLGNPNSRPSNCLITNETWAFNLQSALNNCLKEWLER